MNGPVSYVRAELFDADVESKRVAPGDLARCRFNARFLFRIEHLDANEGFEVERVVLFTGGLQPKASDETPTFRVKGRYPTLCAGGHVEVVARNRSEKPAMLEVRLRGKAVR